MHTKKSVLEKLEDWAILGLCGELVEVEQWLYI